MLQPRIFRNITTGLLEILYSGKLRSIENSSCLARNDKKYRICSVEIVYPNGTMSVISSRVYEEIISIYNLKVDDTVRLRIQTEGEHKGKSFVEISFEKLESISDEKYKNILWVSDNFRINPLSLTPGGSDVVIVFNDGSIYGYDKVKHTNSYVETILKHQIKFEPNTSKEQQLHIIKIAVDSVYVYINTWAEEIPKIPRVDLKKIWDQKEDDVFPWEKLRVIDC